MIMQPSDSTAGAGLAPWLLLLLYGAALIALAPASRDAGGFYGGQNRRGRPPSTRWLFASLFIAWIFAKSVTNAANLGARFGMPGAVAYAAYWLSIPVAALVIISLRRRFGSSSLAEWLTTRYGRAAAITFLLAILIRLYNEVWSNTTVVGTYFGAQGSTAYYAAALLFTALTLAYTLKGGLRTSIWTDAIHALVFGAFLAAVVGLVVPRAAHGHVAAVVRSGSWTLAGGVDLLLVALLQSLSYPFHDPVLTDRGFVSDRRSTLVAFLFAGGVGALVIALFGTIGVTAFLAGTPVHDDAPRVVAASLGTGVLLMVNVIMMTLAGSTIDSAFSAVAKAVSVDVPGARGRPPRSVTAGRIAMVLIAVLGNIPLFFGAAILKATTISGTMVLGLAPIFILGLFVNAPPLSFHLAFWTGIVLGVADVIGIVPPAMSVGNGPYAALLGINLWGLAAASLLFMIPVVLRNFRGAERAVRASRQPGVSPHEQTGTRDVPASVQTS